MFWFILILIVIIILCWVFLKKNKNPESFTNYKTIPNLKPIIGNTPYIHLPNNYKYSEKFYFPQSEILNEDMNKILFKNIDHIKKKKYQSFIFKEIQEFNYDYYLGYSGSKINTKVIRKCLLDVIDRINNTVVKYYNQSNYFYFLFFLLDFEIIKILSYKKIVKLETLFEVYRFEKNYGFQIYLELIIDKNEIIVSDMRITGNISEDNIKVSPFKEESNVQVYKQFPYYKPNLKSQNGYLLDSNEHKKITLSINKEIQFLNQRLDKEKNIKYDNSFKCFNSSGRNLHECISNKNIIGQTKTPGVWDRPCLFDVECPFYKSNKNTKNNLGGCVNGTCQMPLGVKNIGYHFYTDLDKAICYNCIDKNNCCQDQLDLKKYSKLKSPDYAFSNDKRLF